MKGVIMNKTILTDIIFYTLLEKRYRSEYLTTDIAEEIARKIGKLLANENGHTEPVETCELCTPNQKGEI
jgi:hypothetical protein